MTPALPALDALLKEVEALDREATPGPWTFDNGSIRGVVEEGPHADHVVPGFAFAKRTRIVASMHGPGNDGAVTHYRNAAPRLAAMLRVAVEALYGGANLVNGRAECRTALARIERIAAGDQGEA